MPDNKLNSIDTDTTKINDVNYNPFKDSNLLVNNTKKYNAIQPLYSDSEHLSPIKVSDVAAISKDSLINPYVENLDSYRDQVYNDRNIFDKGTDILKNIAGFGVQLATTIGSQALQYLGGIENMAKAAIIHNENDLWSDNFLIKAGESVDEFGKRVAPITVHDPDKSWNMTDSGWWANGLVSVGSTVGMLIASDGLLSVLGKAGEGIGALGKLALGEERAAALASKLTIKSGAEYGMGETAANAFDTTGKYIKIGAKPLATSILMRGAENAQESGQQFNDLYPKIKDKIGKLNDKEYQDLLDTETGKEFRSGGVGTSKDEFAKFMANKAAFVDYKANSVNLVFDVLEVFAAYKMAGLLGSHLASESEEMTHGIAKAQAESMGKEYTAASRAKQLGNYTKYLAVESGSEYLEEFQNYYSTKLGEKKADKELNNKGNITGSDITNQYVESLADSKAHEAGFFGLLGGMVFSGVAPKILSRVDKMFHPNLVTPETQRINEIKDRAVTIKTANADINALVQQKKDGKITDEDFTTSVANVKDNLAVSLSLNAAKHGNSELLKDMLESSKGGDELKTLSNATQQNLTDEDHANIANDFIHKIETTQRIYDKYASKLASENADQSVKDYALQRYVISELNNNDLRDRVKLSETKSSLLQGENQDLQSIENGNNALNKIGIRATIQQLEKVKTDNKVNAEKKELINNEIAKLEEQSKFLDDYHTNNSSKYLDETMDEVINRVDGSVVKAKVEATYLKSLSNISEKAHSKLVGFNLIKMIRAEQANIKTVEETKGIDKLHSDIITAENTGKVNLEYLNKKRDEFADYDIDKKEEARRIIDSATNRYNNRSTDTVNTSAKTEEKKVENVEENIDSKDSEVGNGDYALESLINSHNATYKNAKNTESNDEKVIRLTNLKNDIEDLQVDFKNNEKINKKLNDINDEIYKLENNISKEEEQAKITKDQEEELVKEKVEDKSTIAEELMEVVKPITVEQEKKKRDRPKKEVGFPVKGESQAEQKINIDAIEELGIKKEENPVPKSIIRDVVKSDLSANAQTIINNLPDTSFFIPTLASTADNIDGGELIKNNDGSYSLTKELEPAYKELRNIKEGDTVTIKEGKPNPYETKYKIRPIHIISNGVTIGKLNTIAGVNNGINKTLTLIETANKTKSPVSSLTDLLKKERLTIQFLETVIPQVLTGKEFTTVVTTKTSGTLIENEWSPLNDKLTPYELFQVKDSYTLESIKDGKEHYAPVGSNSIYYNADRAYTEGLMYAMVKGLDGKDIPIYLNTATVNSNDTNKLKNSIIDLITLMQNANRNGTTIRFDSAVIKNHLKDIKSIIRTNTVLDSSGIFYSPTFKVTENGIDFIYDDGTKLASLKIKDNIYLELQSLKNVQKQYTNKEEFETKAEVKKEKLLSDIGDTGYNNIIEELTKTLGTLQYNIPYSLTKSFEDDALTSAEKSKVITELKGRLLTNAGVLLDSKGNKISNFISKLGSGEKAKGNFRIELSGKITDSGSKSDVVASEKSEVELIPTIETETVNSVKTADLPTSNSVFEEKTPINTSNLDSVVVERSTDYEAPQSGLDGDFMRQSGILETPIKQDEVVIKNNINRILGKNNNTQIVENLVHNGTKLYGMYHNDMITIARFSPRGVEYHEAFHRIMDLSLTNDEKSAVLAEAKSRYGKSANLDESLAEEFRSYANNKDTDYPLLNAIRNFFDKILYYINNILGNTSIDNLFRGVNSGVFRTTNNTSSGITNYMTEESLANDFTPQETEAYTNYMFGKTAEWYSKFAIYNNAELAKLAIINDKTVLPIITSNEVVMAGLVNSLKSSTDVVKQLALTRIIEDVKKGKNSELLNALKDKVKLKLDIKLNINEDVSYVNDDTVDFSPEQKKSWDDKLDARKSLKLEFSSELRWLIISTQKLSKFDYSFDGEKVVFDTSKKEQYENPAGLPQYLDFDRVYPLLQARMVNSGNLKEMMSRLFELRTVEPSIGLLWLKLNQMNTNYDVKGNRTDYKDSFLNKWYINFNKSYVTAEHVRVTAVPDGLLIKRDISNKEHTLSNSWSNNIKLLISEHNANRQNDEYTSQYNTASEIEATDAIQKLDKQVRERTLNIDELVIETQKLAKLIGFDLPAKITKSILNSYVLIKAKTDNRNSDIISYFNDNILKQLKFLKSTVFADTTNKSNLKFRDSGNLNKIADSYSYFLYDSKEASYLDTNGNLVYSYNKPSWSLRFFDKIKRVFDVYNMDVDGAKQEVLETLKDYLQDSSFRHSNYFNKNGLLTADGLTKDLSELTINDLNLNNLENFNIHKTDGLKDTVNGKGYQYDKQSDDDFYLSRLVTYLTSKPGFVSMPVEIKSDSTNNWIIQGVHFPVIEEGKYVLQNRKFNDTTSLAFRSMYNTYLQEKERMINARNYLFATYNPNKNNVYNVSDFNENSFDVKPNMTVGDIVRSSSKQGVVSDIRGEKAIIKLIDNSINKTDDHKFVAVEKDNIVGQQLYYHYVKLDNNSKPILFQNSIKNEGVFVTGRVFDFHNMKHLLGNGEHNMFDKEEENGELVKGAVEFTKAVNAQGQDIHNLYIEDLAKKQQVASQVVDYVNSFTNWLVTDTFNRYKSLQPIISKMKNTDNVRLLHNYSNDDEKVEFEQFISDIAINGYLHLTEQKGFFTGNVSEYKNVKDTNKRSKQTDSPSQTTLDNGKKNHRYIIGKDIELKSSEISTIVSGLKESLDITNPEFKDMLISENITNKNFTPSNKKEELIRSTIEPYLKINTADAQGYITLDQSKYLIKKAGRWNVMYDAIWSKFENAEKLNESELNELARINGYLQVLKPFSYTRKYDPITNSVRSLQIKTSVVTLLPLLTKGTQLEDIANNMKSVGADALYFQSAIKVGMFPTSNLTDDLGNLLPDFAKNVTVHETPEADWGIQLDVPSHLKDEVNKHGLQIQKIAISNLDTKATYELNGNKVNGTAIIDELHKMQIANIVESKQNLLKRIGARSTRKGYKFENLNKLRDIIIKEAIDKGIPEDTLKGFEIKDGRFKVPLFNGGLSDKLEAVLTSLFTNNVTVQKINGNHVTLISDALITKFKNTKIKEDTNLPTGIEIHDSIKERYESPNFRLRTMQLINGKVQNAEAFLPAWTKKFFNNGERISINDIPQELREFLGYRIPTEAKYSGVLFDVVGFLPEEMDSSIILPHELVAQTGWDFDVDSLYNMGRAVEKTKDGINAIRYDDSKTVEKNTKQQRDSRIFDIYKAIWSNPYHYREITTGGRMDDPKALIAKYNKLAANPIKDYINANTIIGQDKFRQLAIKGIGLKGIAASINGYAPILQIVKAQFTDGFVVKYDKSKFDIKQLIEKYGEDNVLYNDNVVYINHKNIAHNVDGTYTNVEGNNTTDHLAQMLAMIVDIIKEGVPTNINEYTYNTFAAMVLSGIPIEYAGMFIAQPVIKKLANMSMKSTGITADKQKIISTVKKQFQIELLKQLHKKEVISEEFLKKQSKDSYGKPSGIFTFNKETKKWEYNGNDDKFYLERADTEKILGYDPDRQIALSQEELDKQITLNEVVRVKDTDILIHLYTTQLRLLELWNGNLKLGYKKIGDGLGDAIRLFATDKIGAGFDATESFSDTASRVNRNSVITIKRDTQDVSVNKLFTKDSHRYKTLKAFIDNSNVPSLELFSPLFIQQSNYFKGAQDNILTGINKSEVTRKIANTFLTKLIYLNSPYLQDFDKKEVLGIDKKPTLGKINAITDISIQDFKKLSAANQLYYVKQFADVDNTSFLHYLNYEIDEFNINKKQIHNIVFDKPKVSDNLDKDLIKSFEDILYGDTGNNEINPYMKVLGKNLIAYDMFTAGGIYNANSWNNIIPTEYLENVMKMPEYLYDLQDSMKVGFSSAEDFGTHYSGKMIVYNDNVNKNYEYSDVLNLNVDDKLFNIYNAYLRELFIINNSDNVNIVPRLSGIKEINEGMDTILISRSRVSQLDIDNTPEIYFTHNTVISDEYGQERDTIINKLYKGVITQESQDKYTIFEISKQGGKFIGLGIDENYVKIRNVESEEIYANKVKMMNEGKIDEEKGLDCV